MPFYINDSDRCLDYQDGLCSGPIQDYVSLSGETVSYRCAKHGSDYLDRMEELRQDVNKRFPGWDVPGSPPPPWFDPAAAGERWDDD